MHDENSSSFNMRFFSPYYFRSENSAAVLITFTLVTGSVQREGFVREAEHNRRSLTKHANPSSSSKHARVWHLNSDEESRRRGTGSDFVPWQHLVAVPRADGSCRTVGGGTGSSVVRRRWVLVEELAEGAVAGAARVAPRTYKSSLGLFSFLSSA